MPVVIAGVEALCDEGFSLVGISGTTDAIAPVFIVNGPVRDALGINPVRALGPGWERDDRRAPRLDPVNLGGPAPRPSACRRLAIGRYACCLASKRRARAASSRRHGSLGRPTVAAAGGALASWTQPTAPSSLWDSLRVRKPPHGLPAVAPRVADAARLPAGYQGRCRRILERRGGRQAPPRPAPGPEAGRAGAPTSPALIPKASPTRRPPRAQEDQVAGISRLRALNHDEFRRLLSQFAAQIKPCRTGAGQPSTAHGSFQARPAHSSSRRCFFHCRGATPACPSGRCFTQTSRVSGLPPW